MCIDKLDEMVDKYNNTYHTTIKMKPTDINPSIYIDFDKENDKEGPKFKVGNHVRIPKLKNIFAKSCVPNRSEDVFVIKKVKNTVLWAFIIGGLIGEEIIRTFCEKELQKKKKNKKSLEMKKIKKKKK